MVCLPGSELREEVREKRLRDSFEHKTLSLNYCTVDAARCRWVCLPKISRSHVGPDSLPN